MYAASYWKYDNVLAVNNTCLDPASNLYKCNYTSNNQM